MWIDAYPPDSVMKYGFVSSPRWSTDMTAVASGAERRNQNWAHPLHRFVAPEAIECHEDLVALHDMWMVTAGPANTFSFRDPLDFASRPLEAPNLAPTVGRTDQTLGIGDGLRTEFPLIRRYSFGGQTYDRRIYHPVVSSVLIGMNALPPDTLAPTLPGGPYVATVSRSTGVVSFDKAPNAGVVITAGFLFDVQARFEADDTYDGIVRAFHVSGHADLIFLEVRPC